MMGPITMYNVTVSDRGQKDARCGQYPPTRTKRLICQKLLLRFCYSLSKNACLSLRMVGIQKIHSPCTIPYTARTPRTTPHAYRHFKRLCIYPTRTLTQGRDPLEKKPNTKRLLPTKPPSITENFWYNLPRYNHQKAWPSHAYYRTHFVQAFPFLPQEKQNCWHCALILYTKKLAPFRGLYYANVSALSATIPALPPGVHAMACTGRFSFFFA